MSVDLSTRAPDTTEELLCPDLSYAAPETTGRMPLRGSYPVEALEMVTEIASPSDTRPALVAKVDTYLRAGVQLAWVIWPRAETIDVWLPGHADAPAAALGPSDTIGGAPLFPDFQCSVQDILRP